MIPNLDLILVAFLHGSFIACVLLVVISVILIGLLFSFFLTLFSIVIIDLYDVFSMCSMHYVTLKANLELGLVLILYIVMQQAVSLVLASKSSVLNKIFQSNEKARHVMKHVDA
ncbi:hypothetical protein RGQ29_008246 [Quercus rubra]|uniref:Uncharacterized protein n=1 Tax=Quercus rubra TaxID=3512 RepID=A0AAN7I4X2_QUERU|nr:hypothetical protein RGQ29_008246 [Quercus rubra]